MFLYLGSVFAIVSQSVERQILSTIKLLNVKSDGYRHSTESERTTVAV